MKHPAHQRTRIKFCGMTRAEDIGRASALGVDAVGLIVVPSSKRALSLEAARELRLSVPPLVSCVLLLMDAEFELAQRAVAAVKPDLVQFHGAEPPDYCSALGIAYLKAVPMAEVDDVDAFQRRYPQAAGFVFDSHGAGHQGGSGQAFDWSRLPSERNRPLLLAGGLMPETVSDAVRAVRPFAVDVSSGIEIAPGIKCPERMQQFVNEVNRADRRPENQ